MGKCLYFFCEFNNHNCICDELSCYTHIAIQALTEQLNRLENPPLTVEELKQMDGEPVWLVDGEGHECWGLGLHLDS